MKLKYYWFLMLFVVLPTSLYAQEFIGWKHSTIYKSETLDGVSQYSNIKPESIKIEEQMQIRYPVFRMSDYSIWEGNLYTCISETDTVKFSREELAGFECRLIAPPQSSWDYLGQFGSEVKPVNIAAKIRNNNPEYPTVWIKSYYKPKQSTDIDSDLTLFDIDCKGDRLRSIQYQAFYKNGNSSSSNNKNLYRFTVPDTSDEVLVRYACK